MAGLILFVMLFTVGTGYFLWISTTNGTYSQAQAYRNQAVQNQQGESVLLSASLNSGILTFTALNQGGSAVNLTAYYVNSGSAVVCHNMIKAGFTTCPTSGAASSPVRVVMNPGSTPYAQTTGFNCAGCGVSNPATIEVLTARGSIFTAAYPLPSSSVCAGGGFTPSISTTLSTSSVAAGNPVTDTAALTGGCSPTGNIVFMVFTSPTCAAPSLIYTSGAVVVSGNGPYSSIPPYVPNTVGTYYWEASYSGDTNNIAVSTVCGSSGEILTVTQAMPSIVTSLSATSIPAGSSVSDSAILTGSSGSNAGGPVTYSWFSGGSCSGSPTQVSTVTVTRGLVPSSATVAFNVQGSYSWQAVYIGDSNNLGAPGNPSATSPCEPLSVTNPTGQTQLPLAIQLNSFKFYYAQSYAVGDGAAPGVGGYYGYVVPASTTMVFQVTLENVDPIGRSITINAQSLIYITILNGGSGQCYPYALYVLGGITDNVPYTSGVGTTAFTTPITITSGNTALLSFGATNPGTAGGDGISCHSGTTPANPEAEVAPFITGEYSDGTPLSLTLPFTAVYGTTVSVTDCTPASATGVDCSPSLGSIATLTLAGFSSTPFVYGVWSSGGVPTLLSCATTCGPTSFKFTVPNSLTQGAYYMVFATDGTNYAYATLHVISAASIATTLSSTSIIASQSVTDSATLSGVTGTAGGTVQYEYFNTGTCTGSPTSVGGAVTVTNGVVPNSPPQVFNNVGSYGWEAAYSGDSSNAPATSPCEPLTVTKASPTITTSLSLTSVVHGNSVFDKATLTGASATAAGSVTYSFYTSGTCSGSPTTVNTVTVTNGIVPNSNSHTFAGAGAYGWIATYTGDSNNIGSTSSCEPLTVTTTLTVNPTTITHGTARTITLTGTNFETTTSYSYCLSASSSSIACVSTSIAAPSPGTFTSTGGGAIPASPAVTILTTTSITAGAYYMIVYQGSQVIAYTSLTVT